MGLEFAAYLFTSSFILVQYPLYVSVVQMCVFFVEVWVGVFCCLFFLLGFFSSGWFCGDAVESPGEKFYREMLDQNTRDYR